MAQGSKILMIDDDPNILQLLQLYLVKEGYVVSSATRGDEGLDI